MSNEEEQLDLRCRVCLNQNANEYISVFCVTSTQNKLVSHMILACTGIVITTNPEKHMPQVICNICLGNLDVAFNIWKTCRLSYGNYQRDESLEDDEEDYRCRICLEQEVDELISLYCICDSTLLKVSEMITQYAGLAINETDGFPQYICDICLSRLNLGFEFKKLTKQTHASLLLFKECMKRKKYRAQRLEMMKHTKQAKSKSEEVQKKRNSSASLGSPQRANQAISNKSPHKSPGSASTDSWSRVAPLTNPLSREEAMSKTRNVPLPSEEELKESFRRIAHTKQIPDGIKTQSAKKCHLVPGRYKVISDRGRYTWSQIFSVRCAMCTTRYSLASVGKKCAKCVLPFDNYSLLPQRQDRMEAYCCNNCTFFAVSLKSLIDHLIVHQKQFTAALRTVSADSERKKTEAAPKSDVVEIDLDSDDNDEDGEDCAVPEKRQRRMANDNEGSDSGDEQKNAKAETTDDIFDELIEYDPANDDELSEAVEEGQDDSADLERVESVAQMTIDAAMFDTLVDAESYAMLLLKGALCCGCLKLFHSRNELRQHHTQEHFTRRTVGELSCDVCASVCNDAQDARYHRMIASQKIFYHCKLCQQLILSDEDFDSHREAIHKQKNTAAPPVPPYNNMIVTKQIMKRRPSVAVASLGRLKADNEDAFVTLKETTNYKLLLLKGELCCGCQSLFSDWDELLAHCDEAHPARGFGMTRCERCQENCKTETKLLRHQLKRAKKLFYSCKLCRDLMLETADDFQAHMTVRHPKLKHTFPAGKSDLQVLVRKKENGK